MGMAEPDNEQKNSIEVFANIFKTLCIKSKGQAFSDLKQNDLYLNFKRVRSDYPDSPFLKVDSCLDQSVFGAKIQEDEKPEIARTMEKMSKLWETKQYMRQKFFQKWRLMRLQKKETCAADRYNGLSIQEKLFRKRLETLYEIKNQCMLKDLLEQQNETNEASTNKESNKEIEQLKKKNKEKDNEINLLQGNVDDLESQLESQNGMQEEIKVLKDEAEKAKNQKNIARS